MVEINEIKRIQSEIVEIDLQIRTYCINIKASSNFQNSKTDFISKLYSRFFVQLWIVQSAFNPVSKIKQLLVTWSRPIVITFSIRIAWINGIIRAKLAQLIAQIVVLSWLHSLLMRLTMTKSSKQIRSFRMDQKCILKTYKI